jgi:ATP-binding cassette, subfamily B, heavy metal transporter
MEDFLRTIKLASKNRKLTLLAIFLSFTSTVLGLIQPQIFKLFFDLIDESIRANSFVVDGRYWLILSLFAIITFSSDLINMAEYYVIVRWWVDSKKRLTKQVFSHLHSLSVDYFEKNSTGKIKERVDRGISDLNNVMEYAVIDILPQLLFIIVATIILFRNNFVFGLILMTSVPLFILISIKYTKPLIKIQDEVRDSYESVSGSFTESIINAKTIKSFATEGKHKTKVIRQLARAISKDITYVIKRIAMNVLRFIVINTAQILIIAFGVYWAITGEITLGDFVLAWTYTNRSIQPLWYLTRVMDNLFKEMRSVRRVFELLDTEPEIKDEPNAKNLQLRSGKVVFDKVTFKYENRQVINNFSLEIPAGTVVAFVGKSGVGKSTLIKLLLRFHDPQKGRVIIDGQDIKKVTQKSLRENIGVVMQDSVLFNDSAANNIKYGGRKVTKKNILIASRAANADIFISNLPQKYETIVGERGVKLSGGEQQRINIARAFLKNPPILVLDEATSSLDSESEQKIQEAIWTLAKGRTTLIVAHRLSTVMKADLIVVMDKGKIAEMGTHKELINKEGIYSNLFNIQSGNYLT